MGDQPARIEMRCTILAISVAIMYASASPIVDDVVPEESYALDDDLSEAQQKIDDMTAAGKSDKDCRKLVTETRKEIQTNVDTCQKTVNALPTGSSCPNEGQAAVKTATEAKSKADKQLTHTSTEVIKASTAKVTFESRSFSSLTEGKCESFYSSSSYTTAKANYKAAVTAKTKAKGAAEEAAKALKAAIAAAAEAKLACECKTRADHEKAFSSYSAADAANQKSWNFACKVECVLDGKTNCKCDAAPKCQKPKLTAAVNAAKCYANKYDCKHGYYCTKRGPFQKHSRTAAGLKNFPEKDVIEACNADPKCTGYTYNADHTGSNINTCYQTTYPGTGRGTSGYAGILKLCARS